MIPCYGDYLFQIGLIDELERQYFKSETEKAVYYISLKDWTSAFEVYLRNVLNFNKIKK